MSKIQIEIFQKKYQEQVIELILAIQTQEFDMPIALKDQPDLLEISNFYQQGLGNFWVALDDDKVVGTIALIDIGDAKVALRKMFVHADYRGKEWGIAKILLDAAIAASKVKAVHSIYLGTTAFFLAAQRFYEKNGFYEMAKTALPESFPVMPLDTKFYRLDL